MLFCLKKFYFGTPDYKRILFKYPEESQLQLVPEFRINFSAHYFEHQKFILLSFSDDQSFVKNFSEQNYDRFLLQFP